MDEIQKVLVKAGRKDLAQKYYLKVAASKIPAVPKIVKDANELWKKLNVKQRERFFEMYGNTVDMGYEVRKELPRINDLTKAWKKVDFGGHLVVVEPERKGEILNISVSGFKHLCKFLKHIKNKGWNKRHLWVPKDYVNYILTGKKNNYDEPELP